jgi:RNA polymerase II-associated factor 1
MKTEHDSFLAFYLTEDDEQALKFKETRFDLSPYEVPENEEVSSTMLILIKKIIAR